MMILLFAFLFFGALCFKDRVSRICGLSALISLLIIPVYLSAYEVLNLPPDDPIEFLQWTYATVTSFKGASVSIVVGSSITILLWIFNYFRTKEYMDRLKEWKFIIPIGLGALAEICFNFPEQFTWNTLIAVIVRGASMNGAVAIALHHTCKRIKNIIK